MRITLVTGKHALLIVSRIICFASFCSLRLTTTLTIVNFYFVGKGIHQYLCRQRATPRLPVDHLDYALVQEYTLNEISNVPKATFARLLAGLPRARSARRTEPHTHGIWSTSFRLVVT